VLTQFAHAYHLNKRSFSATYAETLADRILVGPVLAGHDFVDHRDLRGFFRILRGKRAPSQDWYTHGLKVMNVHGVVPDHWYIFFTGGRTPFNGNSGGITGIAHGNIGCDGGRLDAGKRACT